MIGKIILLVIIIIIFLAVIYVLTGRIHPLIARFPELLNILNTQGTGMLSQLIE